MALSLEQYNSHWTKSHEIKDILMKRHNRQRKRSSVVSIKNADCIPAHLIIEILSWLPVEVLLRFKTVCKLWYSVIKSSHFISKHLKNYYDNNNSRDCLIVQYYVNKAGEINVYEFLVDDKSNEGLSYQEIDTPVSDTYICGPCHGLYFLWQGDFEPHRSLWNPALNEFAQLPDMIQKPNLPSYMSSSCMAYGFGIDSKTRDYKVIVIQLHRDERIEDSNSDSDSDSAPDIIDYPPSLFIYSLNSNSWRYWGELQISYYLRKNKSDVFVNDCYYWLGSYKTYGSDYEAIISFDLTMEAYEEIRLPKFEKKPWYGSQLVIFHDSIAFVCLHEEEKSFCIWTWNKGTWTPKITMDVKFKVWGAFSHWRDNMIVFNTGCDSLVLCDTDTSSIWTVDNPQDVYDVCNLIVYKESLVSIKKLVVYNQKLALNKDVEIPDWFWPEEKSALNEDAEIPDWFWCEEKIAPNKDVEIPD